VSKTFPRTGAYQNDCPFCGTHNALLDDFDYSNAAGSSVWKMKCRDGGGVFFVTDANGESVGPVSASVPRTFLTVEKTCAPRAR
jgi:hypothetical protein